MTIQELLQEARNIWGKNKMSLGDIVVAGGVTQGDISRITRDASEGANIDQDNLKKELGNIIFSTIRWCDDLGYNPEDCIKLAIEAQEKYQKRK